MFTWWSIQKNHFDKQTFLQQSVSIDYILFAQTDKKTLFAQLKRQEIAKQKQKQKVKRVDCIHHNVNMHYEVWSPLYLIKEDVVWYQDDFGHVTDLVWNKEYEEDKEKIYRKEVLRSVFYFNETSFCNCIHIRLVHVHIMIQWMKRNCKNTIQSNQKGICP